MKKYLILIVVIFTIFQKVDSKIIIVNNQSGSTGNYKTLTDAVNAASVGDTIYLVGSSTSYGNATISKRLVIIGEGYKASEKDLGAPSSVGTITLDSTTTYPINGCVFKSLYFYRITYASGDANNIHNVTIDRCGSDYELHVSGSNWFIKNSIIDYIDVHNNSSIIVTNCIITDRLINSNSPTALFVNNDFFNSYLESVYYGRFENNIFFNENILGTLPNYCIFNNNLTFDNLDQTLPPTNNSGVGNLSNTDPVFVNGPTVSVNVLFSNVANYDLHLSSTSPAKNKGTDGTDLGIYGGAYPMPNMNGVSNLPFIKTVNVTNPVIDKDKSLQIKVKAYKHE